MGEFVKTGKLDFRDLVTSMIADLAKLAARRFILGPIANALSVISFQKGRPIRSFIVRREAKDHGTMSGIEGNVKPGDRVAVCISSRASGAPMQKWMPCPKVMC